MMKHMKIYKLLIALPLLAGLQACSGWLDLEPKDTTTETDLFQTGDGYRIALNGVYQQMSETGLYGKELSWGFLDVLAQMYTSYLLTNITEYRYAVRYQYENEKVKDLIEVVWSKAYNNVANCNNIIQRIETESVGKFAGGELERNLIDGEALALRAYLHFDMLRLFAPSMAMQDKRQYIPYVTTYPCTFQPYFTNEEIVEKAIADLKKAKALVESYDLANSNWLLTQNRIEGYANPDDLFFAYRGYRMNYYAISALLARVYNYAGMHKEAFEEATAVIDAKVGNNKIFSMSTAAAVSNGNMKLYDNVIFCLSNQNLWTIYEPYHNTESSLALAGWSKSDIFDSENDTRANLVIMESSRLFSLKNVATQKKLATYVKDMLPMIRLGEMYFIRAEYYNDQKDQKNAISELDKLRAAYNCSSGQLTGRFEDELLDEVRREYFSEGQLFYYYKKLNITPSYDMTSTDQFVLPHPDNESL